MYYKKYKPLKMIYSRVFIFEVYPMFSTRKNTKSAQRFLFSLSP